MQDNFDSKNDGKDKEWIDGGGGGHDDDEPDSELPPEREEDWKQ